MRNLFPIVLLLLLPRPVLMAQHDMLGVTFFGQSVAFDSRTGDAVLLTTNAVAGQNAMARIGNDLFSTDRVPTPGGSGFTFSFGRLSSVTGQYTRTQANIGDLRGLAAHPTNPQLVFGILQADPDVLVTLDIGNGTRTTIGSTGRNDIQALTLFQGQLLAWDTTEGLMRLSMTTGHATDLNPNLGGSTGIQFLTQHSDGRLLGGQQQLFQISPNSGAITLIAAIGNGRFDIRGAEERMPLTEQFGSGCNTALNVPSVLTAVGGTAPGLVTIFQSVGHEASHFGALVIGFTHHSTQAQALPLSLDPLLGTSGCTLYTSIDLVSSGLTDTQGRLGKNFTMPPGTAGMMIFAQAVVFETVPGGLSWSNGVMLKVGF